MTREPGWPFGVAASQVPFRDILARHYPYSPGARLYQGGLSGDVVLTRVRKSDYYRVRGWGASRFREEILSEVLRACRYRANESTKERRPWQHQIDEANRSADLLLRGGSYNQPYREIPRPLLATARLDVVACHQEALRLSTRGPDDTLVDQYGTPLNQACDVETEARQLRKQRRRPKGYRWVPGAPRLSDIHSLDHLAAIWLITRDLWENFC